MGTSRQAAEPGRLAQAPCAQWKLEAREVPALHGPLGLGWAAGYVQEAKELDGHLSPQGWALPLLPCPPAHHMEMFQQRSLAQRGGCSTPGGHQAFLTSRALGLLPGHQGWGRRTAPLTGKHCGSTHRVGRALIRAGRAGVCTQPRGASPSGLLPLQPGGQPTFQKEQTTARSPHVALCPGLQSIPQRDAC